MQDKFTLVKKGYDPTEVNKYIENLELVIKGYKEKDAAINNALISAQVAAGVILKEAEQNAAKVKLDVVEKLDTITNSITEQKRMVKEFQDDYNNMVDKYIKKVNETEILNLYSSVHALEEYITGLIADEIEKL